MGTLFIFIAVSLLSASSIFFFFWNKYLKNKKNLKNQKETPEKAQAEEKEQVTKIIPPLNQQTNKTTENIEKLFGACVNYVNNSYSGEFRILESLKNGDKVFFVDQLVDYIKGGNDLFCLPEDLSLMKRGTEPLDEDDIIYLTQNIGIKYTRPLIKAEKHLSPALSKILKKNGACLSERNEFRFMS